MTERMMKLTSEELREELNKQRERECYEGMVNEYLRVKKILADTGTLTHDECCEIAVRVCGGVGLFAAPFRR